MSMSLGVDIVNIPRFKHFLQDENRARVLFSPRELLMSTESLAGNFAVKESFVKAFSGTIPLFQFPELEVLRNQDGAPYMFTENEILLKYVGRIVSISISHDVDYSIGVILVC